MIQFISDFMDQFMRHLSNPVSITAPTLELSANTTLPTQLSKHLRELIKAGALQPGDPLPPSRQLAEEWGLARGTVVAALDILCAEDLLTPKQGAGMFVSEFAAAVVQSGSTISSSFIAPLPMLTAPAIDKRIESGIDFRPCRPSIEQFPKNQWKRCISDGAMKAVSSDVADPQGVIQLREQICALIRRSRGLQGNPGQVFISLGIVHAVHLLSELYIKDGTKVIMEDPGYPLVRQLFEASGAEILACPVDEEGLVVDALPRIADDVSFVYVTPSHQFPRGSRLSARRRIALINWATHHGVIILEDDYDGEFRYDVPPLPPLASVPNDCVVYLGTFSKTMFPDVRVGYVIAPSPVIEALANYRAIHEYGLGTATQYALSEFIARGQFEAHVARMLRFYRQKRKAVTTALEELQIPGKLIGLDSGLHSILEVRNETDVSLLSERAAKAGVVAPTVSRYALRKGSAMNGLVIGYAEPSLAKIARGMMIISNCMRTNGHA